MKTVYAIDFGTTNSLLAAARDGKSLGFAPLDPAAANPSVLRSLLYFPNAKSVFYGSDAVREFSARDQVGRLIRSIKRQLPRRSFVGTFVDDRPFNLEDLIAVFLAEMKRRADVHFVADVRSVVLGRPARFSNDDADDRFAQDRLERAARLAGFKEIEFFAEPIAAAHGYAGPTRWAEPPLCAKRLCLRQILAAGRRISRCIAYALTRARLRGAMCSRWAVYRWPATLWIREL